MRTIAALEVHGKFYVCSWRYSGNKATTGPARCPPPGVSRFMNGCKMARISFPRIRPMHDVIDIQVTPLSSACGAEISGVDLTRPLSAETVRAIRDAWNKYIVLVFRGQ